MNVKYLLFIGASALFIAIFSLPYGYYVLLRWCVSTIAGYAAYLSYEKKRENIAYILSAIVVLFNPIFPVYLSKGIWVVLDMIVLFIFLYVAGETKND